MNFLAKKAILCYKISFKILYTDLYTDRKLENLSASNFLHILESARVNGSLHASLYQNSNASRPCILTNLLIGKKWFSLTESVVIIIILIIVCFGKILWLLRPAHVTTQINHIIFFCPITTPKSSHLRTHFIKSFPYHPINIFPVLNNPCPKLIRLLMA